jgi:membrane protein implicated in regulation of membrane protease activity
MPWWGWIAFGSLLLAAEMVVPTDFFLLFLGAAALVVGVLGLAGLDAPAWGQWLVFAALAVVALVFVRGWLRPRARDASPVDDTLVGETGTAEGSIAPGGVGQVELRGTTWSARNAGDGAIAARDRVRVVSVERLTLNVQREG